MRNYPREPRPVAAGGLPENASCRAAFPGRRRMAGREARPTSSFAKGDESVRGDRRHRRGMALIVVLVCLIVAAALAAALLQMALAEHQAQVRQGRELEAAWLAESGLERAAARLAADADYPGETWTIPAADLGGPHGAAVRIAVEPVPDRPDLRQVAVEADYPDHPHFRARRTRQATLSVGGTR